MDNKWEPSPPVFVACLMFTFSALVSGVIYFTHEELDAFDWVLILLSPLFLGAISYFVVRHPDPND